MVLSKLLSGVSVTKMFQTVYGHMVVTHDVQVGYLRYDSRKVERGDLFVAIRGKGYDGHAFITSAIAAGAKVVVLEDDRVLPDSYFMHTGVVKIVVPNTRSALARMAATYYGNPAGNLAAIGVTGTNGKTTTTHIIRSILEATGMRTGLIGTIEYRIANAVMPATHTTPESLELQELLAHMVKESCRAVVMEVSSHALDQHRVDGIPYRVGVFTNITQDHLDYHSSMEEYFTAKRILFEGLSPDAWAVVNLDDPWGERMLDATRARKISFGFSERADVYARDVRLSTRGTMMTIVHGCEESQIDSRLIGRFNVSNLLAAYCTGLALGIPRVELQHSIGNADPVRGRFEPIVSPRGWTAVVDYAHTPDALEKAISAIREIFIQVADGPARRIITVFGCGGNRDRTKRPKMARIATTLSDITIVTSDNPRLEDPNAILNEIMTGVETGSAVHQEVDRKLAILKALEMAQPGDVVLIAGKGHEDYQVIGGEKHHFSDREVVEEYLGGHA